MSQQKVFFAIALVAGCVALASCQNFDINQCTQSGQKLVSEYTETIQQALSQFTSQASQQGQGAVNVQKITDQANQIMKELQSLVNTNGFNFEQTMSTWMRIVRLQSQLATGLFNPSMGISMARLYMELLNTVMNANSNFALNMSTACVPQLRSMQTGGAN